MRLEIVRGGGVSGLTRRTALDADDLPAPDRDALKALLDKAGVAAAAAPGPPAHADETTYEVRIDDGGSPVMARYGEATLPDAARELIAWVGARPEAHSAVRPPAG
jgi:hypothetical protein